MGIEITISRAMVRQLQHCVDQNFQGMVTPQNIFDFTYEIWLRRSGANGSEDHIGGFRMQDNFSGNFFTLTGSSHTDTPSSNNLPDIDFRDRAAVRQINPDAVDIGVDEWHQLVVAYEDATGNGTNDGTMRVYLDGIQTVAFPSQPVWNAGNSGSDIAWVSLFVVNTGEGNRGMAGDIAVNRIYNRTLSAAEVLQNFNATGPGLGIPEPAAGMLMAIGMFSLAAFRRQRL
jgi:hypothetical protein